MENVYDANGDILYTEKRKMIVPCCQPECRGRVRKFLCGMFYPPMFTDLTQGENDIRSYAC